MAVRKTDTPPADAGRAREARAATPSERRPEFRTTSDITLKRLYTPDDIAALDYEREQGVPWTKVGGTIQNDVLKEYAARGTYIYPPAASLRIVTDVFAFCTEHVPSWNTISISGYHMREAGCTAAQELGFTLANGIAYVDAAVRRGLDVDQSGPP